MVAGRRRPDAVGRRCGILVVARASASGHGRIAPHAINRSHRASGRGQQGNAASQCIIHFDAWRCAAAGATTNPCAACKSALARGHTRARVGTSALTCDQALRGNHTASEPADQHSSANASHLWVRHPHAE